MIQTIKDLVSAKADTTVALAREIWGYAELSYEETKSAAALIAALKQEGFTIEEGSLTSPPPLPPPITAGSGKPVVGFLAEYDALSGLSQKAGLPGPGARPGGRRSRLRPQSAGCGCYAAAVALKDYLVKETEGRHRDLLRLSRRGGAGSKQFIARAGYFDNVDLPTPGTRKPSTKWAPGAAWLSWVPTSPLTASPPMPAESPTWAAALWTPWS